MSNWTVRLDCNPKATRVGLSVVHVHVNLQRSDLEGFDRVVRGEPPRQGSKFGSDLHACVCVFLKLAQKPL